MFLKNTVKNLFSSKKQKQNQTTRKPKHKRNSQTIRKSQKSRKSHKHHKHHKKTKQNSRYKQSGFNFKKSKSVVCCEKPKRKKPDKYTDRDNYINVNPLLDSSKKPICKTAYTRKNSCNMETKTFDSLSNTEYDSYKDYLQNTLRLANHKIAIVGAGPSGITAAYYLIKSGFSNKNIIILEKSNRIGGQSNTRNVDGRWVEAGTSYLTNAYKCITDIAYKMNVKVADLEGDVYNKLDRDKDTDVELPYFESVPIFKRYIAIRKKHWIDKNQLYNPTLSDNYLTFRQWLTKYKIESILDNPLYIAGFHAQLYGWADTVSAHNALQWMTPGLLYSVISHLTRALPNGFENLWRKVASYYDLDIRFNTEVTDVIKRNGMVKIKVKNKKPLQVNDVFICSDFSLYKHPYTSRVGKFDHTNVYSCRIYADTIDNRFLKKRPYYILDQKDNREMEIVTCRSFGKNKKGKYIFTLCSYLGNVTDIKKIRQHTKQELVKYGITNYKIIDDFVWKYNIRYSTKQFKQKIPQLLENSQQVWYNSGTMSHWNVESIARHSIKKVRDFLVYNKFDTFLIDNYKEKSLYDKLTTQNLFPQYKQSYGITFDIIEKFM